MNPETGYIDYDRLQENAKLFHPKLIIAGHFLHSLQADDCCSFQRTLVKNKMKNLNVTFPVGFFFSPLQEQAAIPETSTMPAWSRLPMRTVHIWWETWLTSVDWWLLQWCRHPSNTVTLSPQQHTRRCEAAVQGSSSTGKVGVEELHFC